MTQNDSSKEKQKQQSTIILLVDDNPDIREFLTLVLQAEIHADVLLAEDATHTLKIVETITPDLFMLDYQLPDMNGLKLAEHLSTFPHCASIPMLLMSANLPKQALESKHIATIEKPFNLDDLIQVVCQLLIQYPKGSDDNP